MKKAVVFLLTAVTIAGTCVTPNVAYATDGGTKTVSETVGNESEKPDSSQQEDTKSNEKPKPRAKTNKGGESNEEASPETPQEIPQETTKPEEIKNEPFKPNHNLGKVGKVLTSYGGEDGFTGEFITKDEVILIGFNRNSADDGFKVPGYYYKPKVEEDGNMCGITYATVEYDDKGTDNLEDDTESVLEWYNIMDDRLEGGDAYLKDADYLNTWVKHNMKSLSTVPTNKVVTVPVGDVGNVAGLVVFSKSGDYIGTINLENEEADKIIYDKNFMKKNLIVNMSNPKLNEEKTGASVHFEYDFTQFNPVLGEEILLKYVVRDEDDNIVLDGIDLESTIDRTKPSKGVTKDFTLTTNGKYKVQISTTTQDIEKTISIRGIKDAVPMDTPDLEKPRISYSGKPNGVLDGTPFSITVYSSKPAYITFNGESSGALVTEHTFTVEHNGNYKVTATTEDGAEAEDTIKIDGFVTSLADIAASAYGKSGSGDLPQTGGIRATEVLVLGVLTMLGGIGLIKKDELMYFFRKKVSR